MEGNYRNNKKISSSRPVEVDLAESEETNKRLFKVIDQMHLLNLDEAISDSSAKFKQVIRNISETSENLKIQAEKLASLIVCQKIRDEESELASEEIHREEKDYATSFVQVDTPGEQPKIIKKIVRNTEMNLAKLKELLKS